MFNLVRTRTLARSHQYRLRGCEVRPTIADDEGTKLATHHSSQHADRRSAPRGVRGSPPRHR